MNAKVFSLILLFLIAGVTSVYAKGAANSSEKEATKVIILKGETEGNRGRSVLPHFSIVSAFLSNNLLTLPFRVPVGEVGVFVNIQNSTVYEGVFTVSAPLQLTIVLDDEWITSGGVLEIVTSNEHLLGEL